MKHKLLKMLAALLAICAGVLLLSLLGSTEYREPGNKESTIPLSAPPFVRVAHAAPGYQSVASFLDDEAGIAAYTQISGTIDLDLVIDEFRTIEYTTSEYIVGSVGIPDYPEEHDPHVYVHTDGWVLAYYLAHEPASHIIDLRHYDGSTIASTKLENAMKEILGEVPFTATYYDFQHPNATHLMLIVEAQPDWGDDSFGIQLPNSFDYYERSWAHAQYDDEDFQSCSTVYIDEVSISYELCTYLSWAFRHGSLTAAQLPPGVSHTIRLSQYIDYSGTAFCGLALVYREVP
jgi:hypothetical protein